MSDGSGGSGDDFDLSGFGGGGGDGDLDAVRGEEIHHPACPFDDDHAVLFEQFLEADLLEVFAPVDAVSVEVIDGQPPARVDVEQDVSRAADTLIAAEGANQSSDELRLARPQIAVQGDALAALEGLRQLGGDGFGLGN